MYPRRVLTNIRLTTIYLRFLNRRHAALRASLGKEVVVVDTSMVDIRDDDTTSSTEMGTDEFSGQGVTGHKVGEKAFDDETDLKNEDFIFVY